MLEDVVKELSKKYNKSEKLILLLIKICEDNNKIDYIKIIDIELQKCVK